MRWEISQLFSHDNDFHVIIVAAFFPSLLLCFENDMSMPINVCAFCCGKFFLFFEMKRDYLIFFCFRKMIILLYFVELKMDLKDFKFGAHKQYFVKLLFINGD